MRSIIISTVVIFFVLSPFKPMWAMDLDLSVYLDKTLSECENNTVCSRRARWQCIVNACNQNGTQRPTECYLNLNADKIRADSAICQAVSDASDENIQHVVEAIPEAKTDDVLQGLVMMRAMHGDGAGCQDRIKAYVGAYGASWTKIWIEAMSGCRILSNQRTLEEEESDFQIWQNVILKNNTCIDIVNLEMQSMCNSGMLKE